MRLAMAAIFLALAGWFVLASPARPPELPAPVSVDRGAIRMAPSRSQMADPPAIEVAGMQLRCQQCHAAFESLPEVREPIRQHVSVRLDHGRNDRCYNCHSRRDREKLVLEGAQEIPFAGSAELCARCHGTVWRDWARGMHGRTVGSWDPTSGLQTRLTCVECHDPHAPAFPSFELLPGPRTLRMGEPQSAGGAAEESSHNPLERWKGHARGAGHDD
jgi:hypothetical protein